jgi:hypothetical protein
MAQDSKFWRYCVPARVVVGVVVWFLPERWLPLAGCIALAGVAGLLYRTFTYDEKQLGAFNQRVTWNTLRPLHAMIWTLFAVLALSKNPHSKWIPFIDVGFGALAR